ncbi:hypothetical protein AGMMS50249_0220 [candidate division SR1 bacterium]|nr:hypothetical protein AGMMS50249_0220 [candidate division SR1 bacterium]
MVIDKKFEIETTKILTKTTKPKVVVEQKSISKLHDNPNLVSDCFTRHHLREAVITIFTIVNFCLLVGVLSLVK